MRVLVTGGTGVVGTSTVSMLVRRGHQVRLLSRHAGDDARQWPEGVEPWPGNVADAGSIERCADGCDAVLHLVAIVDESPPHATFDRVNVQGTRNIVAEAERAGVPRFVYVSSLGADRGESPYHRSKREGEEIVRTYSRDWLIVRPGSVYGPGDEQISMLLRMIRTMPAVPQIGGGDQGFQPIWHEDLAEVLALAVERSDLRGQALDVAGPETTSQRDLIERLTKITDRAPVIVPLPNFIANAGLRLAETVGIDIPFNESQMTMLQEGNLIDDPDRNALTQVFGVEPTPLTRGLKLLADAQAEVLPEDGVGALRRKRFWVDVQNSRMDADELFEYVRTHFNQLTPSLVEVDAEPGTPNLIESGETLTLSLPMRGHVQVRVAELRERRMTMLTLEGHPIAGAVRFLTDEEGGAVRFEVQLFERASNVLDLVMMRTLGDLLQNRTWETMASNVVQTTGGEAPEGVKHESTELDEAEVRSVESWSRELVVALKRSAFGSQRSAGLGADERGRAEADFR